MLRLVDPSGTNASQNYEKLRTKLICFFAWKRCENPEDLTDRTIDRVARKIDDGEEIGNVTAYCRRVAGFVLKEYWDESSKRQSILEELQTGGQLVLDPRIAPDESNHSELSERRLNCMRQCLDNLSPDNRGMITEYYHGEKRAKIDKRGCMAKNMLISKNAQRIRIFRLRRILAACVNECLERASRT